MRCPIKLRGHDHDAECDPDCAWLVDNRPKVEAWQYGGNVSQACALAALASRDGDYRVVNVRKVDR